VAARLVLAPTQEAFMSTTEVRGDATGGAGGKHGEHEKCTGTADEQWPEWYAAYMVAEQAGPELPT
jgi:hypothetical protein